MFQQFIFIYSLNSASFRETRDLVLQCCRYERLSSKYFSWSIKYSFKEFYFASVPSAKNVKFGDISERVEIRDKLKCKPFSWFLENIYPELRIPNKDAIGWGAVSQRETRSKEDICIGKC